MRSRLRLSVRGAVQGVGFRPFVWRLARGLDLAGWVANTPFGAAIEVEGPRPQLDRFRADLVGAPPPHARLMSVEAVWLDATGQTTFEIRSSDAAGDPTAIVLPDLATCEECRREIFDPTDRRYRYPFTNCTHCGPRFTIIEALPYDRPRTSMRKFAMCAACAAEYDDPGDRRFHAQPIACPQCGPQLAWWSTGGTVLATRDEALRAAVAALRHGAIVAVKGLGGFHLLVDARRDDAVRRLRQRKHREEKPFALLYPSMAAVEADCEMSPAEADVLLSAEAPIVLLRRRRGTPSSVAASVAPGCPTLGVMLPYTPLHHLLAADFGAPLVATSGNLSDEPICIDEHEALARLGGIADGLLVHDRPILRHVDDSIARVVLGREILLRRARGYAPWPVTLRHDMPPMVAVGAHLKNTIAVTAGRDVFLSQHIGDLDTPQAIQAFHDVLGNLDALFRVKPRAALADLHPDYVSGRLARTLDVPVALVQHHLAHVAGCLAEHDVAGPALGVSWDGTGYGSDGTVWGGEFLRVEDGGWQRVACLRPFRLPGGERAVREPRRSALGVLSVAFGNALDDLDVPSLRAFDAAARRVLLRALDRGVNAPVTTSAGRLFDAVASIAGVRQQAAFEGQAAMLLEWAALDEPAVAYPFEVVRADAMPALGGWDPPPLVVDWVPMVRALVADVARGIGTTVMAARAHETLAQIVLSVAREIGESQVALSGGCFQNRRLLERTVTILRDAGFVPYWPHRVPPNDGGIALGQVAAWARGLTGPPTRARAESRIEADTCVTVGAAV